jgi:hypothetical protein
MSKHQVCNISTYIHDQSEMILRELRRKRIRGRLQDANDFLKGSHWRCFFNYGISLMSFWWSVLESSTCCNICVLLMGKAWVHGKLMRLSRQGLLKGSTTPILPCGANVNILCSCRMNFLRGVLHWLM